MASDMPAILMVDDDPMLLELYHDVLAPRYRVLLAASVAEAVAALEAGVVDAVGCDYLLGDGSGEDVVAWIHAHRPALLPRTLLISGADMLSASLEGVMVITKPVPMDVLLDVFATWFPGDVEGA